MYMKKSRKLIFSLLFVSLILPNFAFASWYNPFSWNIFSWFHKSDKIEVLKANPILVATSTATSTDKYNKLIEAKNKLQNNLKTKINEDAINKLIEDKNK